MVVVLCRFCRIDQGRKTAMKRIPLILLAVILVGGCILIGPSDDKMFNGRWTHTDSNRTWSLEFSRLNHRFVSEMLATGSATPYVETGGYNLMEWLGDLTLLYDDGRLRTYGYVVSETKLVLVDSEDVETSFDPDPAE
jgi:hypothetical protein